MDCNIEGYRTSIDNVEEGATIVISGLVWDEGWDIPTLWALLDDNRCYMNDAHGHALCEVGVDEFLSTLRDHQHETVVRLRLGRKRRLPSWAAAALNNGWTPPPTFVRDDYEK